MGTVTDQGWESDYGQYDDDVDEFGEEYGDDEYCDHQCDEECEPCTHEHCMNCGGCGCPGYCDDYQTYNLRPDETGGAGPVANTEAATGPAGGSTGPGTSRMEVCQYAPELGGFQ